MKSLLQTKEWASFRETQGWKAYEIEENYVLLRPLALGKTFLYAPEIKLSDLEDIKEFLVKTKEIAQKNNAIFLRLDINEPVSQESILLIKKYKFIKAFEEIQPEYRQIVSITGSEEEILAQMKPKGRYNIRLAQKHGVKIQEIDDMEVFYKLFEETARRDGFTIRPKAYFKQMLDDLGKIGYVKLLAAYYQNKPVAAEILSIYKDTASYLYGASANEARQTMAPYLMHWEAIKLSRENGCKFYDLLAVAPFDGHEDNSINKGLGKKYAGITRFKEQFGGEKVRLMGGWDYIYQPFWYKLFKFIEKVRR